MLDYAYKLEIVVAVLTEVAAVSISVAVAVVISIAVVELHPYINLRSICLFVFVDLPTSRNSARIQLGY